MEMAERSRCIIKPDDNSDKDDSDDVSASAPTSPDTPPAIPLIPPEPRRQDTEDKTATPKHQSSSTDTDKEVAEDNKGDQEENGSYNSEIDYVPIQNAAAQTVERKATLLGTDDGKDGDRGRQFYALDEKPFPCVETVESKDPMIPHLLKSRKFGKDDKGCQLENHEENYQWKLLTRDADTDVALPLQYYDFANLVCSYKVAISKRIADRLSSPRGKSYLDNKLYWKKDVYIFVNVHEDCHYLNATELSKATVKNTITDVMSGLKESKLPLTDGQIMVFGLPEWKKLQSKLETEYHVTVEVSSTDSDIVIEGMTDDVERASREIQDFLS